MIRYGIVGFGLHAVRRMMPGFGFARQSKAVALTRRDKQKAHENAHAYKIPLVFDSAEELCSHPDIDAVFVTTPNQCHLSDVLTAIRHGKHVLCEKPLALNADECRQMVEAARAANVRFGVAQVFRYCRSIEFMRERAASLGKIALARAEFNYPGLSSARTWINDRTIGGGTIADVGVHCIDALRYVLQDEVVRVQAQALYDEKSGDVDAAGAIILQFGKGILATVSVSMRAEYFTAVSLVGPNGAISADYATTVDNPISVNILKGGKIMESQRFNNYDAYGRMLDGFSAWIEQGTPFRAPGAEGLRNQILLDAAYESARTGQAVPVQASE